MKKIHLIAIGGRAMHSLAIALKQNGYFVTGSDDVIFNPSKQNLLDNDLYPSKEGWFPEKITKDLDAVILGRHANNDNPELLKAIELGLKIYSYPEFIYDFSKDKKRVVIAGSHGKNTIASMVMHVLNYYEQEFDYLVSMPLDSNQSTIKLSTNSKIIIIEGDEDVTTTIDNRSKFEHYKPNIALLSGIAWDHINIFPTFEAYVEQFKKYITSIESKGKLIFSAEDEIVAKLVKNTPENIKKIPFNMHPFEVFDSRTYLKVSGGRLPIHIFGKHNMHNIAGAIKLCQHLKISEEEFYKAIKTFKGTGKHLNLIGKSRSVNIYLDFAHTPAKISATIKALREQYNRRELIVCLELFSSSSLHLSFLNQYNGSMNLADEKLVFFDPSNVTEDDLIQTKDKIKEAFGSSLIKVFTHVEDIKSELFLMNWKDKNLLLMSSENFSGIDFKELSRKIISLSD